MLIECGVSRSFLVSDVVACFMRHACLSQDWDLCP